MLSFSVAADYHDGQCGAGMVYQSCGSACPVSCDNLGTFSSCAAVCVEGCFCPDGLVEYRDRCVDPLECPALLAGEFSNVESVYLVTLDDKMECCTYKYVHSSCVLPKILKIQFF